MLIFLLRQTGQFNNSEIAEQFGLTYSSVTLRIGASKKRWEREEELKGQYEKF
jgi:DNA-directed RNA polymerase specialized sigma24 family protein